jgi:hypothetical protein
MSIGNKINIIFVVIALLFFLNLNNKAYGENQKHWLLLP